MSLQKLLAEYPNFSARRVRKLATQLQSLEKLNSPEAKGIAADLMALTLQVAKMEAQLADVAVVPNLEQVKHLDVVPTSEAIRAVDELAADLQRNTGTLTSAVKLAKGIVHTASFRVEDPRTEGPEE